MHSTFTKELDKKSLVDSVVLYWSKRIQVEELQYISKVSEDFSTVAYVRYPGVVKKAFEMMSKYR